MNCKCGSEMELSFCHDTENGLYAFNLFTCDNCGTICKVDVWKDKGKTWIDVNNNIARHHE